MRSTILAAALLLAAPGLAMAQTVTVAQPWARATAPHAETGAAYATLTASVADRLTGASTPVAAKVEVHLSMEHEGVMHMHELETGLGLQPGRQVVLSPGSLHLMLTGLKQPLVQGGSFPLTLSFANEPPVTVTVAVTAAGASGPAGGHMHH